MPAGPDPSHVINVPLDLVRRFGIWVQSKEGIQKDNCGDPVGVRFDGGHRLAMNLDIRGSTPFHLIEEFCGSSPKVCDGGRHEREPGNLFAMWQRGLPGLCV